MTTTDPSTHVQSTVDTETWEPFMAGDTALGEVSWVRTTAADPDRTLIAALWRCEPRPAFPYPFTADETMTVFEGEVEVTFLATGEKKTFVAGDVVSFTKGTESTWHVLSSFKKLFVMSG